MNATLVRRAWFGARAMLSGAAAFDPPPKAGSDSPVASASPAPSATYGRWVRQSTAWRSDSRQTQKRLHRLQRHPAFDILCRAEESQVSALTETLRAAASQTYPHFRLFVLCPTGPGPALSHLATDCNATIVADARWVTPWETQASDAHFVIFLAPGVILAPDALLCVAEAAQTCSPEVIYGDHDYLADGLRHSPCFKPAWSPDLLTSWNYLAPFVAYATNALTLAGGPGDSSEPESALDLALRVTEHATTIVHIPRILCHVVEKESVSPHIQNSDMDAQAMRAGLARRGIAGDISPGPLPGTYRVQRTVFEPGLTSIIIPVRDRLDLLQPCIKSIESNTAAGRYEIVIVDNGSTSPEMLSYLHSSPHIVIRDDAAFNYARLNNMGAEHARGEYLLFLNSDTEVLDEGWLDALLEHAQRPEVGAVGGKLLYPDGRIQHAGVILGINVAGHAFKGVQNVPASSETLLAHVIRNVSAVTGACLMMRRDLYCELGGMDAEHLAVSFNDVDLCLRLRDRRCLVVYTPYATLRHHESATRTDTLDECEVRVMRERWGHLLDADPYYNPNLTRHSEDFSPDPSIPESTRVVSATEGTDQTVALRRSRIDQLVSGLPSGCCSFGIRFASYGQRSYGRVTVKVFDLGHSDSVETWHLRASSLRDNEFEDLPFEPSMGNTSNAWRITLTFTAANADQHLSAWISTIPSSHSDGVEVNGTSMNGSLALRVLVEVPPRIASNFS